MKTLINIKGMSCMHCVASVKNAIEALSGVSAAEVNLEAKNAEVEYDDALVSVDDIISAVEEQGFDASI